MLAGAVAMWLQLDAAAVADASTSAGLPVPVPLSSPRGHSLPEDQHLRRTAWDALSHCHGTCTTLAVGTEPESLCIGSAARPRRPSPATFFGSGQVDAAAAHVAARQPARVFVNALLSGVQQRNLERAWGRPVLDRVALIIEIFSQRARTAEVRWLGAGDGAGCCCRR